MYCVSRNFSKKDLARIRTIFPKALIFKQEKNIPGIYGRQRYSEYQLTVEAAGEDGGALPAGDSLHITALMSRKEEFRSRITRVVLQHHKVRGREGWRSCLSSTQSLGFPGLT